MILKLLWNWVVTNTHQLQLCHKNGRITRNHFWNLFGWWVHGNSFFAAIPSFSIQKVWYLSKIQEKIWIFFLLFIGPFWSKRCSQRFWYQKRNCQCYHPCQKYHSSCQKFPKIRWCESWYHFCSWWRLLATFDSWRIWNYCSGGWIWTCSKTCRGKLPILKPWYNEPQYSEFCHIVH